MKRLLPLVLALLSLGSVLPAAADQRGFRDGDEQPFCESPGPCPDTDYMDFRWLTQGHGEEPRRVRHGFRAAKRWAGRDTDGRHGVTFVFDFDTDRGFHGGRYHGDSDIQLRARKKEGRWRAFLYQGEFMGQHVPGRVRVWRPGRRSLKVGFAVDLLREGIGRYRWQLSWHNRNTFCPGSCHSDGTDWFEHRV